MTTASANRLRLAWLRWRVRIALRRTDGVEGSPREQRVIDAYDALVEAERRKT